MSKTKRQLRAEAVGRIRKNNNITDRSLMLDLLGEDYSITGFGNAEAIIDLLTDEPDEFAKNGEFCESQTEHSPKSDAVEILRKAASGEYEGGTDEVSVNLDNLTNALSHADALYTLADMIERDYVPRDEYDDAASLCHRYAKELCELRAERDEWQNAYDDWQLQTEGLVAERDEWRAKAEEAAAQLEEVREETESVFVHGYSLGSLPTDKADDAWNENEQTIDGCMAELGWVRLPRDADGEYIKIGDVVEGYGMRCKVVDMTYTGSSWYLKIDKGNVFDFLYDTNALSHHHEPTLEDVLDEMAVKVSVDVQDRTGKRDEILATYAARIRELMGREQ